MINISHAKAKCQILHNFLSVQVTDNREEKKEIVI